jgi:hypothetical protein
MRVDKFVRRAYHRATYPLDVALSRADSFIIGKLRERKWQNILIGLCLTYASVGVWLVWSAWLTREVTELVVGVIYTSLGVVWATVLALRMSISTRIDAYAVRAIQEQTKQDRKRYEMSDTEKSEQNLYDQSDEVIERYAEKASLALQESGFIPFTDGATESMRYENMIADKAQELYLDDYYEKTQK